MIDDLHLPLPFINRMKAILGSEYNDFESSFRKPSPISIRLNSGIKVPQDGFYNEILSGNVPWCDSGKYLTERPLFTLDPLFHSGSYYVQDAASMFVEQCVKTAKQQSDIDYVLDLCAAPGGKSTHLATLFPDSLIISNEVIRSRASILEENISKWGTSNVVVTSSDPAKFARLNAFFDFILVDAPCSGEGMFRKDPKALEEWSPENVKHCAARQIRILNDIWDSLKPGGFMLYGTCTYNIEENENIVKYVIDNLGAESIPVDVSSFGGITLSLDKTINAYRFFPHKTQTEGLFLSLLRKGGESNKSVTKRAKQIYKGPHISSWVNNNSFFTFTMRNDNVYLLPEKFATDIEFIGKLVYVLSSGTEVCTIKGKELIPSISFAHFREININNFPVLHIDKSTALKFLKREALNSPPDIPKGYVLLIYSGVPLGWVKNIGTRCNNILPQNRRIRMGL